jgi:hypothetical protein
MKTLLISLTLLLCTAPLPAQKKDPAALGTAVLEISGAKLRLGMTKGAVTDKLAGSTIRKIEEDWWMLGSDEVRFKNGVLVFASRYWTTQDNDITGAIFGAVTSLNSEGISACIINADTVATPDMTAQRVWFICGEKTLLIVRDTMNGKVFNMLYERIGNYNAD